MFIYNVTHIDLDALMPHLDTGGTHNNFTTDNDPTKENIMKPIKLINEVMELNGVKNPRLAIQALNG